MPGNQSKIRLVVRPAAARNEVVAFSEGTWYVRVAAPPVEGKANRQLVSFLSKALGVAKGSVTIVSGHTARRKVLMIDGLTQEEITRRLSPTPSSSADTTSNLSRRRQSRPG